MKNEAVPREKQKSELYRRGVAVVAAGAAAMGGVLAHANRVNAAPSPNKAHPANVTPLQHENNPYKNDKLQQAAINQIAKHPEVLNMVIVVPTGGVNSPARMRLAPSLKVEPLYNFSTVSYGVPKQSGIGDTIIKEHYRVINDPILYRGKNGKDWLLFHDWDDSPWGPHRTDGQSDPYYNTFLGNSYLNRWIPADLKYFPKGTIIAQSPILSGTKKHILNARVKKFADPGDPTIDGPQPYLDIKGMQDFYIGLMEGMTTQAVEQNLQSKIYEKLPNQNIEAFIHSK